MDEALTGASEVELAVRRSCAYDGFRGFWPSVADDLNATPIQWEISWLNNANYRGTFSPDGDTLSGAWHYPGGSAYEATATTRVR